MPVFKDQPLVIIATLRYSCFFFCLYLLSSCTPKLVEPLQKIQRTQYATGWKELANYPIPDGRSDDLHFFDAQTGFVINSNGFLSYTEDGGKHWEVVHKNEGTFFRCITFKNKQEGWLGTIGTDDRYLSSRDTIALYETKDGGQNWMPVQFKGPQPKGLCGLQKVTDDFIVGCGRVRGPSYFIKTIDGGKNWTSYNMDHLAGSLIATHFHDELHGFLIGGTTRDKNNCRSMVLETVDGGMNWDTIYLSQQKGEYPWKFAFPTKEKGFISIQRNVRDGRFYHLQTEDGGKSWKEVEHTSDYYYVQGIGFANENIGWIGGSSTRTFETRDGGKTWNGLKNIGSGFNNFQVLEDGIIYGVGFGVFKCSNMEQSGNGIKEEYFDDGQLKSKAQLIKGKKNGRSTTYHQNGQIASSGSYKENLKVGIWKYFDPAGGLSEKIKMKNGVAPINEKLLSDYIGNYNTQEHTIRNVFLKEGQLYTKRVAGNELMLFPETSTRFFYGFNPEVTIEFFKNKDGMVTHSQTFQNGQYATAQKID